MYSNSKVCILTLTALFCVSTYAGEPPPYIGEAAVQVIVMDGDTQLESYRGSVEFCNPESFWAMGCTTVNFKNDEVVIFPVPGSKNINTNSSGWQLVADGLSAAFGGGLESNPDSWPMHKLTPMFDAMGNCELRSGAVTYEINGQNNGPSTSSIVFTVETALDKDGGRQITGFTCEDGEDFL